VLGLCFCEQALCSACDIQAIPVNQCVNMRSVCEHARACCAAASAFADPFASFSTAAMAALACLSRSSRFPSKSDRRAVSESRSSAAAANAAAAATPAASDAVRCSCSSSSDVASACASPACIKKARFRVSWYVVLRDWGSSGLTPLTRITRG